MEIELPEGQIGVYPEFGRRRVVTVSFDRPLTTDQPEYFAIDLESSLVNALIAFAKARQFDGLYAAANEGSAPGWLGIYHLRWQNSVGTLLEDELVAVQCSQDGVACRLEAETFGQLILEPLTSAQPLMAPGELDVGSRLKRCVEGKAAGAVTRDRQPCSLYLLAAASLGA